MKKNILQQPQLATELVPKQKKMTNLIENTITESYTMAEQTRATQRNPIRSDWSQSRQTGSLHGQTSTRTKQRHVTSSVYLHRSRGVHALSHPVTLHVYTLCIH